MPFLKGDLEMVDRDIVYRKLSELENYLSQIREYTTITLDSYRSDWKAQRVIERTLQIMIETCADIANHIISDSGMRAPTSYSDTFKVLFENSVIDPGLYEIMSKMAKFRNIVVHQYEGIDPEIVISILKKNLNDFIEYKKSIIDFFKKIK